MIDVSVRNSFCRIAERHDLAATRHGRNRESAAKRLAKAGEVRFHSPEFLRATKRQPEPCDKLVEYQAYSMTFGKFAQPFQETRLRGDVTLHGLEDDSGDPAMFLFDDPPRLFQVIEWRDQG